MATSVKKAVIPIAGLGTRFLPLSKALPKEFWPLADLPAIQYIVEEAAAAGIKEIIFTVKPGDKRVLDYFGRKRDLEKKLKKCGKPEILKSLEKLAKLSEKISFSQVVQKNPLGDGHAVLQAKNSVRKEPCLILFGDDIVDAKIPCSRQLVGVFKKYRKPIIALYRLPAEKLSSYGIVKVEKIGPRLYKIKGIEEKPEPGKAPSNLAIVGKYVINSEVFDFLEKTPSLAKGEIRLAGAFDEMIKKGLTVYGYEFEGKWLECGNKLAYLKSNIYLSLKHPQFGKELKKFLKEEKIIN
jgi:UTP--glucose-1-phosphate uridylyltransferase